MTSVNQRHAMTQDDPVLAQLRSETQLRRLVLGAPATVEDMDATVAWQSKQWAEIREEAGDETEPVLVLVLLAAVAGECRPDLSPLVQAVTRTAPTRALCLTGDISCRP